MFLFVSFPFLSSLPSFSSLASYRHFHKRWKVKRERKSRKSIEKNIFKASDFTACSYTTKLEEQKSPPSQSSTQHADKTLKLIPWYNNNNNSNNNQIQEKRKHDKDLHRRVKAIGIESSASELHLVHISSTRNTSCSQLNMNMHERPCLIERYLQYFDSRIWPNGNDHPGSSL